MGEGGSSPLPPPLNILQTFTFDEIFLCITNLATDFNKSFCLDAAFLPVWIYSEKQKIAHAIFRSKLVFTKCKKFHAIF